MVNSHDDLMDTLLRDTFMSMVLHDYHPGMSVLQSKANAADNRPNAPTVGDIMSKQAQLPVTMGGMGIYSLDHRAKAFW